MKLLWEIIVYLRRQSGIRPVGWMRGLCCRASRRWRLFWYSVSLLKPHNEWGNSPWYQCLVCGRLCNCHATPGGVWAEATPEGAKLVGECGRCQEGAGEDSEKSKAESQCL